MHSKLALHGSGHIYSGQTESQLLASCFALQPRSPQYSRVAIPSIPLCFVIWNVGASVLWDFMFWRDGDKAQQNVLFLTPLNQRTEGTWRVTELAKHLGARKRTLGNGIVYFPARSAARTGGGGCDWGCPVKNWPGLGFMFYSWGTIEFFLGFLFPTQSSAFPQFLHHRVFLSLPFPPSAEFGCSVLGLQ